MRKISYFFHDLFQGFIVVRTLSPLRHNAVNLVFGDVKSEWKGYFKDGKEREEHENDRNKKEYRDQSLDDLIVNGVIGIQSDEKEDGNDDYLISAWIYPKCRLD